MVIGDRLKLLRNNVNKTQQEFSDFVGIKRAVYNHYENNRREMSLKVILSVSKVTKCNLNWLLNGEGTMFIEDPIPVSEGSCQVLSILDYIAAGPAGEASEQPLGYLSIGTGVIKDVGNVSCFKVNGSSMEPEIKNGDLIVVNKHSTWEQSENKVCAVSVDRVLMLKRVLHDPSNKNMMLVSLNIVFQPMIISPEYSNVELIGVLQTVIRNVD